VGKSRLLYEFRQSLRERRVTYLEGRCLSYGGAIPYLPILDLLRADCGIVEADTHAVMARKVLSALQAVGMDEEALPYLLLLLGVRDGTEALREMSPETVKARTFQALIRVVLEESRRQPLVLAIEDLHWVDKISEELLTALAGSVAGAAVLVLGTYRPGYRPPWMDQSYATQIPVRPLSAEDSRSVVASALVAGSIVDDLAQSIVRKGEGNPFFLEELARSVAERGVQRVRQELPDTIQGVLLARIDRLPESAKRLLQTAAVLGREAPLRLLRETHDAPAALDADLQELKHQEFLYERTDAREPMFVFKHVLTQEAAYESLLSGRRGALHEAAGQALERLYADRLEEQYDLLAYHYSRSANSEKAIEYLVHANRKAMKADAPVEAKAYFERALHLLEGLPAIEANRRRQIALLADQIVVFQNLFKMQEYYDLLTRYEPIAVELNDPALLGPLIQQIGHCDWTFGRFEQADRRFKVAAQLCEETGNYAVAAQTYQIWMWNHQCLGNFREVLALQERAELAWEKGRNLRWYVYALSAAALAYGYLGRFNEGIEVGRKAVTVAERLRDTTQLSFAAWALAFVYTCKGDLIRAVEYGTLGVEKAPTPAERAWAQGSLAAAWCRAGEVEKAIEILAPLAAALRSGGFVPGERFVLFLGEAYWRAGRDEEARRAVEEGLEIHTRHGMKYEAAVSLRLLGEVAASGNTDQVAESLAEQHFRESIEALEQLGAEGDLALACAGYGRLCGRQGRVAHACEQLARALSIIERLGIVGEAERVRAELEAFAVQ
jgi:tetratricopeptide (TPR) repeat protein